MKTILAFLALAASTAFAQSPITSGNYLWEVASITNRVYLYGTIHAGKEAWFPLPSPVERAFTDSKVLVIEADITNAEAMAKSSGGMTYTAPDKLDKHVNPDDLARFRRLAARFSIPDSATSQMKPFMAVSLLVFAEWGRLGYLPQHGIDLYLIGKAKSEGRKVIEIEGIDTQMMLMDSLTEAENRTIFGGTLGAIENGTSGEQITGIVNAWQSGDPALVLEIARKYNAEVAGAREFEEKFIWSRHDAMAKKIEGYLNDTRERHFIAVGALHLAGPRGLVEILKKRGYVVKQL